MDDLDFDNFDDFGPEEFAGFFLEKYREEVRQTTTLEQTCTGLREELDDQHRKRMESFMIKMKPIIIKDGPSVKANYKIQAAKIQYEIYALTQRLRFQYFRCEHEEKRRQSREKEVRKLRDKISDLRIEISTITKGIPISKIELQDIGDNKPVPKTDVNVPNPVLAKHSIALEKQPAPKPSKAYLRSQLNTATQILTKS